MASEDGCCWPHKSVNTCLKVGRVNGDRSERKNMEAKTLKPRL